MYIDSERDGLFSVGGEPLQYARLPLQFNNDHTEFGFSADGRWLAYALLFPFGPGDSLKNPILSLLSYQGEKTDVEVDMAAFRSRIPEGADQILWSGSWINSEVLHISIAYLPPGGTMWRGFDAVFDPFRGVWREDLFSDLVDREPRKWARFSPDLTRAIYTTEEAIVLMDLVSKQEVWRDTREGLTVDPWPVYYWSPDSSRVVYYALNYPQYLISRDGQTWKEIRDILSTGATLGTDPGVQWSPDGRYLAITREKYFDGTDSSLPVLYLYDIKKDGYIFRCPFQGFGQAPGVFWSPDSRYLIPTTPVDPEDPLIMIDSQMGKVYKLADKARAQGWSAMFPSKWP